MDKLDKLGNYFVYHNIHGRFGIKFVDFISMVETGTWEGFITLHQRSVRFAK